MLLPKVIEYNSGVKGYNCTDIDKCAHKYAQIAKIMGFEGSNTKILVRKLISETEKMVNKLNMPLNFKECKVKILDEDIHIIAEGALKDSCINTNPRAVKKEDVVKILKNLC